VREREGESERERKRARERERESPTKTGWEGCGDLLPEALFSGMITGGLMRPKKKNGNDY